MSGTGARTGTRTCALDKPLPPCMRWRFSPTMYYIFRKLSTCIRQTLGHIPLASSLSHGACAGRVTTTSLSLAVILLGPRPPSPPSWPILLRTTKTSVHHVINHPRRHPLRVHRRRSGAYAATLQRRTTVNPPQWQEANISCV